MLSVVLADAGIGARPIDRCDTIEISIERHDVDDACSLLGPIRFSPRWCTCSSQAGQFDAATWERGRRWALMIALVALPYYIETNPRFADMARRAIREVLSDHRGSGATSTAPI